MQKVCSSESTTTSVVRLKSRQYWYPISKSVDKQSGRYCLASLLIREDRGEKNKKKKLGPKVFSAPL